MSQFKLLTETMFAGEGNIVTEAASTGKTVWLNGCFMQAETKNRNGRIYPMNEMSRAVQNAMHNIKMHNGIFGELDHPQSLTINMDRISHVITELSIEGNNVNGRAKLIDTPMGLIAQELAKTGVRYGVSSRGGGQVNESGLVSDFHLLTVDLVATPSAAGAMPQPVYESLMNNTHGREVLKLSSVLKEDASAQKFFKSEILKFLNESTLGNFKK